MGGNVISYSSFRTLNDQENEVIEKAIWNHYHKLRGDLEYSQKWGNHDVENIKHKLHLMRYGMRKLKLMK